MGSSAPLMISTGAVIYEACVIGDRSFMMASCSMVVNPGLKQSGSRYLDSNSVLLHQYVW